MTTIANHNPTASLGTAQSPASRSAWREEMLGRILEQMRERRPEPEKSEARKPKAGAHGKGRYLDVYV
ncbi:MAG: hypothetical protein LBL95_01615 [Deltaproteobacteria bacterium]|jgi:hypothetical protein|nr:hypothetical protein [Deltaproteobacteria bacterium]